ncbi:MAG: PBP1A family penicillin-binding protein [Myxococcota bacterium]
MKRLAHLLLALGFLAILGGVSVAALFYAFVMRDLPEIYTLQDYRPNLITRVLAADGSEIATFARERRVVVPIEEIPEHVVQAFIAAEDSSFYEHEGLDYAGILRAAITNLRAGEVKQGGSTITQQVAKTFLLSLDRNYVRKLKDMVLAMRIERALNKNEILFLYLNQIYLGYFMGPSAYGIEAAAQAYFGKSARDLSLAESALIAGLVPAPSAYTPHVSPENAFKRQRFVLRRMQEDGFIDARQRAEALAEQLGFKERERDATAVASAYFVEEVRRYLEHRYGADILYTGGLEVKTTLDPQRQRDAYAAVRKGLRAHDRRTGYRGPIRNAPRSEWTALLVTLGEENGQRPATSADLWRALVMQIDDEAQEARLAIGPGRETILTLKDLRWARKPDPSVDGIIPRVKRVSQALHVGDLVWLEKVGERPPEPDEVSMPVEPSDEALASLFEGLDMTLAEPIPIFELYQEPEAEGSLVSIDLENKHLLAMIGGYTFERSQYNRALQAPRQPGSAFKAIIYAAALEQTYTPATIVYDTPIVYVDEDSGFQWKPENYSDKFYGPIPLRQALAKSRNIATIKILQKIGLEPVHEMAQRLGIRSRLEDNLGLALGNSEVTLGELVRAYTTFATGGRRIDPIFISEIRDRDGLLLEENTPLLASLEETDAPNGEFELVPEEEELDDLERAIGEIREVVLRDDQPAPLPPGYTLDPVTAYLMTDMLQAVVQEGTGFRVRELRRPVAGKTGTTNNLVDAWFIGYTPQIATGVWVGYDRPRNLGKNETGSRAASPIFLDYMQRALRDKPMEDFPVPEGVVFARIDRATGLLARPGDENALFQPFRDGTIPAEMTPGQLHSGGSGRLPRVD